MQAPHPPTREETEAAEANPPAPADSDDGAAAPAPAQPAAPPKKIKATPASIGIMVVVAAVGIALIMWAWHLGPFNTTRVSTDNAYVRGAITVLAPQVSGYVADVAVKDFQYVKAGQELLRIDDRIYAQRVRAAESQVANATAQLNNAEQTQAQNTATVGSARANLVAAQAESARARAEQARVDELAERGSVSLSERDRVRTSARLAAANVLKAQAEIEIAQQRVKGTTVSRGGLEAQVAAAEAQLALAKIDLANTVIRAPRDGQVSEASVRRGQYVTAGSQLLFLVPDTLWVVANFKEGQTWRMRIGQQATFKVDAFEGATLTGYVEQIAPATGSEFSVLRPDNASGNFTKVVQRLPVRIAIDPDQPLAKRLRPGMSVTAEVDTGAALHETARGARPGVGQ
ncbi:HlyD family secretion protein [Massilia sp. Leaf139]|uniref:HlyD family secretion protein n=1 Tax=Massilia sp. Leaf139 TaxID=1736272 RepID=UPI0006F3F51C|nr:HlyD family secretion protein [Massilia sp. Leaf139]KQQ97330.1 hemolysin secretion protein D [Massilia sp. Leaf139]